MTASNPAAENSQMAEIDAMTEVARALQPLEAESRRRVLQWAADSFGATVAAVSSAQRVAGYRDHESEALGDQAEKFTDLAALYAATAPKSDPEKALVVGYWFQKIGNDADFDSGSVNRELNHLGYRIGNITSALGSLIARKPQLVIQTRKSGSTQQARKRYRLTNEGIKQVERMVRGGDEQ